MFADLLERSYVWRLAGKASLGGGVKVRYRDERVTGDMATVDTELWRAGRQRDPARLSTGASQRAVGGVRRGDGRRQHDAELPRAVPARRARVVLRRAGLAAPRQARHVERGRAGDADPDRGRRAPTSGRDAVRPREITGPIDLDRQAIARDVAAVVTPGLVVSDVADRPPRAPVAVPALADVVAQRRLPAVGDSRAVVGARRRGPTSGRAPADRLRLVVGPDAIESGGACARSDRGVSGAPIAPARAGSGRACSGHSPAGAARAGNAGLATPLHTGRSGDAREACRHRG